MEKFRSWKYDDKSSHKHLFEYSGSDRDTIFEYYTEFRRLLLTTYIKKQYERGTRLQRDNFRLEEYDKFSPTPYYGKLGMLVDQIRLNVTMCNTALASYDEVMMSAVRHSLGCTSNQALSIFEGVLDLHKLVKNKDALSTNALEIQAFDETIATLIQRAE